MPIRSLQQVPPRRLPLPPFGALAARLAVNIQTILGSVEADEERAIREHLATCGVPHAEAHDLVGAASVLDAAVEPVTPSPALRARLMTTIAETPQAHRPAAAPTRRSPTDAPSRPCLDYHIGRCLAPCVAAICGPAEYQRAVEHTKLFLESRSDELIDQLLAGDQLAGVVDLADTSTPGRTLQEPARRSSPNHVTTRPICFSFGQSI